MNGQKKSYEQILSEMGRPVDIDDIPNRKMDLKGLLRYARGKGKKVSELSEEEKRKFIFA